jgi:hypothetical protein
MNITFNLWTRTRDRTTGPATSKPRPAVYLAGKIAPHDWREKLIGADMSLACDDDAKLFDPSYILPRPTFDYIGPFYVACDHCCGHGPANHGVGATGSNAGCLTGFWGNDTAQRVFRINYARIQRADVVFAFIDQTDCYGTLIELGIAFAMGKRVVVAFGKQLSQRDIGELWMASKCAALILNGTVDETWAWFLKFGLDDHSDDIPPEAA